MHCCDIIGYTDDGACYCDDCGNDRMDAIFAEYAEQNYGMTCDACGACYTSDGWYTHEDATNPEYTRWARCSSCNSQVPYAKYTREYRNVRRAALLTGAFCHNCHKTTLRF